MCEILNDVLSLYFSFAYYFLIPKEREFTSNHKVELWVAPVRVTVSRDLKNLEKLTYKLN